jgi:arylsulfatase A-like enzyme
VARGIDVAPTLLGALGLAAPSVFAGRDLLASAPAPAGADEVWACRDVLDPNRVWALRTPEHKLYDRRLFDLGRDPGEKVDVAETQAETAERLAARRKAILEARPRPKPRPAVADDELRERLRALGYVE